MIVPLVPHVQWPMTIRPAVPSAGVSGSLYFSNTRIASAQVVRPRTTWTFACPPVTVETRPHTVPGRAIRGLPVGEGDGVGIASGRLDRACGCRPLEQPATATNINRANAGRTTTTTDSPRAGWVPVPVLPGNGA